MSYEDVTSANALEEIARHLNRIANFLEREPVDLVEDVPVHDGRHGPSCAVCHPSRP